MIRMALSVLCVFVCNNNVHVDAEGMNWMECILTHEFVIHEKNKNDCEKMSSHSRMGKSNPIQCDFIIYESRPHFSFFNDSTPLSLTNLEFF